MKKFWKLAIIVVISICFFILGWQGNAYKNQAKPMNLNGCYQLAWDTFNIEGLNYYYFMNGGLDSSNGKSKKLKSNVLELISGELKNSIVIVDEDGLFLIKPDKEVLQFSGSTGDPIISMNN